MSEMNLHDLRKLIGEKVSKEAEAWARCEASVWPYGTYSPNDLVSMYEKGYLWGFKKAFEEYLHRSTLNLKFPLGVSQKEEKSDT